MKVDTARFGTLEFEPDKILHFDGGVPGFASCTRFVILDHDRETPLKWLQSLDRPDLALLIVEPQELLRDYRLELTPDVLERLGAQDLKDLGVFVILNPCGDQLTANLRAPVVAHVEGRRALQLILDDARLPLRHAVGPPSPSSDPV
jgi:flagellar assembly factor FliW